MRHRAHPVRSGARHRSSAVAAPAAAAIPVTHRGLARSFAVVTGSTAHDDEVDLSKVVGADTLVVLMAAGRLAQTCADLIAAGRPADEPAAIVQWAWTPDQRSVVGTLADLPILAEAANIGPPATLVVGPVATLPGEFEAVSPKLSEHPSAPFLIRPVTERPHRPIDRQDVRVSRWSSEDGLKLKVSARGGLAVAIALVAVIVSGVMGALAETAPGEARLSVRGRRHAIDDPELPVGGAGCHGVRSESQ